METADLHRRLESLIRLGKIAEVDHAARKIRIQSGDLLTQWLPWPAEIGRNFVRWRPLRVGTQVVMASPSGDIAQAVVIGHLYTEEIQPPSTEPEIDLIQFEDGSFIQHNAHEKSLHIHSAGTLKLSADHTYIEGPVTQQGGDITSDDVSVQHHKHDGVRTGPSQTGEPSK